VEGLTMTTTTRFGYLAVVVAMVACGGQPGPTLQQLQISPVVTEVTENLQASVVATAIYSDGTTADVTAEVAWASVDGAIASAAAGVVQAGQPGRTYLTASYGGLQTAARVDVVAATLESLWLSAESAKVPAGLTARVVASGAFSDGSVRDVTAAAAWSSTRDLAEVSAGGQVKALRPGYTQLRASVGDKVAALLFQVTDAQAVSLAVQGLASMPVGQASTFQVLATFTDGTTLDVTADAVLEVLDAAVASLRAGASLLASGEGLTALRASYAGLEASAPVQVTPVALSALELTCPATLPIGNLARFAATGTFSDGTTADVTSRVTWLSGDPRVAVVSTFIMPGAILPYGAGTVTITAIDAATQVTASCTVTVQ
jgi:hypothetical protein